MIVTRFAPSPTGLLHLGHAFAAITAAESGEDFLLRIEDLDGGRAREEFALAITRDLKWLGLSWNEPVLRQSRRGTAYQAALARLTEMGLTYRCTCTRSEIALEIARAGEAQHGPEGPIYPGTCRNLPQAPEKPHVLRLDAARAAALVGPLSFIEQGRPYPADPLRFGDIVLARKGFDAQGWPAAYHLAVVVDDAFQGVTLVTRGEDLLSATHVQRLLQALLELPEPAYAHHRLILDETGKKFSKRDQAVTLAGLRESGATPADVRAMLEG